MAYIPHTATDKEMMLKAIGVSDSNALFDEIPAALINDQLTAIPDSMNEMQMLQMAQQMAENNCNGICFTGAGSYDHFIPAAVWDITSRGEFLTAYTPYQAEASQGTLQLLYEFQTMIAELTGMEVANASLYDGATAVAEAALMAVRLNKHSQANRILVAGSLHPYYRQTLETIVRNQHIEVITLPIDEQAGVTPIQALAAYENMDVSALIIPQPNFFGCLEAVDEMTDWARVNKVISIASVNPTALALLNPPGSWGTEGVDIVCGEGQPLGVPMASGGPYFGFISTRMSHVRQLPGRLIGRTLDKDGKMGYTLTLQAREQHIRRGKATSNICTNQGLLVTAATIYMSLMGAEGLKRVALQSHQNTQALVKALTALPGVSTVFISPTFHEVLLRLPKAPEQVLAQLAVQGILGGVAVGEYYPQWADCILVCATEVRTAEEIAFYAENLAQILA